MGTFRDNVRTMAETQKILDRLNAMRDKNPADKGDVEAETSTTVQAGNTSSSSSDSTSPAVGTAPIVRGTDKNPAGSKASNDLSDSVTEVDSSTSSTDTPGGGSRADAEATAASGVSTNKGVNEVGAEFSGDGTKITMGTPQKNGTDVNSSIATDADRKLRALVGLDPDDPTKTMLVRFDGLPTVPTDAESTAAGQNSWIDVYPLAPVEYGFELGYRWYNSGNIETSEGYASRYFRSVEDGVAQFTALTKFNASITECAVAPPFTTIFLSAVFASSSVVNPTTVSTNITVTSYYCPGAIYGSYTAMPSYSKLACTPGSSDSCPATAPRTPYWPTRNSYVLNYDNNNVTYSAYDSEVPLKYRIPMASVRIQSAVTGDLYQVAPGVDGGIVLQNLTGSDYFLFYDSLRLLRATPPISALQFYEI